MLVVLTTDYFFLVEGIGFNDAFIFHLHILSSLSLCS